MYNEQIEQLISAALADGVLTEKEKQILFKKAQGMGIDLDEFEMVLDARLVELQKAEKEKAEKSAPKSNKYGDVRKCPVCGALVPALAGTCPECGYEFSGVDANLSSQRLLEMLMDVDKSIAQEKASAITEIEHSRSQIGSLRNLIDGGQTEKESEKYAIERKFTKESISRKTSIIQNFVVPSTKADLFEFIVSLQTKMTDKKLKKAYQTKLNECILKAKTLFPNDDSFLKVIDTAEQSLKSIKRRRYLLLLTIVTCSICIILGIYFCHPKDVTNNARVCNREVKKYVENNDLETACGLLLAFDGKPSKLRDTYKLVIDKAVNSGDNDIVKSLIQNYDVDNVLSDSYKIKSLIKVGEYQEAERYLSLPEEDFWHGTTKRCEAYYDFLTQCVNDMCEKGNKAEAKAFIKAKVSFFAAEPKKWGENKNKYYIENVRKNLTDIVSGY